MEDPELLCFLSSSNLVLFHLTLSELFHLPLIVRSDDGDYSGGLRDHHLGKDRRLFKSGELVLVGHMEPTFATGALLAGVLGDAGGDPIVAVFVLLLIIEGRFLLSGDVGLDGVTSQFALVELILVPLRFLPLVISFEIGSKLPLLPYNCDQLGDIRIVCLVPEGQVGFNIGGAIVKTNVLHPIDTALCLDHVGLTREWSKLEQSNVLGAKLGETWDAL
jgi:hypothetical protein